jgi:succinate-acetate transporter protein
MATNAHLNNGNVDPNVNKEYTNGHSSQDHATTTSHTNGNTNGNVQNRGYDYGGNPLAHMNTGDSARLPAFGGEFQPGLYRPIKHRKFANPAPLGLCGFALTTFVLSLINIGVRGVTVPSIVIGAAFGYGGLVQLLAGMWEMAVGNTFGATALSSYGGFWISLAIILTPGGFQIADTYAEEGVNAENYALGYFLAGWFIFNTMLLICTLKSTVAFFLLFFFLDLAFLFLFLAHLYPSAEGEIHVPLNKAGGYFGLFSAFLAWYNALAGLADDSNSFFVVPVAHFPWSEKGRENRGMSRKSMPEE